MEECRLNQTFMLVCQLSIGDWWSSLNSKLINVNEAIQ